MDSGHINKSITGFVRNTLGCGCPDEVFEKIEYENLSDTGQLSNVFRINIGDTLLVYIVRITVEDDCELIVRQLLIKGKDDRDHHGFNRFRLVLAGNEGMKKMAGLQKLFESLANGDKKLHLHFVKPDLLKNTNFMCLVR